MKEILVRSTLDGSIQPSLFFGAEGELSRPLLVGLHTWSFGRDNQIKKMLPFAEKHNFNLLLPEFRGNNLVDKNPNCTEACGSPLARQDIIDAIDYVIENENVDRKNVFLLGASGGGHMALMMAGMRPDYFKAIGAFVPITDLARWEKQNPGYSRHVRGCCLDSEEEMLRRSPVSYLDVIAKANLKIFHGKYDRVVPVSQSIEFFNTLNEKYPASSVYLDIFDGGHEMDMNVAEYWLISQYKKNKEAYVGHCGDVCTLIRVALTGRTQTPDLYEILKLFGNDRIKARFEQFFNII